MGNYKDSRQDKAPHYTEFPYFSSFCGECDTCYKCATCYSDEPGACDQTISDDFFRKYGDPAALQHLLLGAERPDEPMPGLEIPRVRRADLFLRRVAADA